MARISGGHYPSDGRNFENIFKKLWRLRREVLDNQTGYKPAGVPSSHDRSMPKYPTLTKILGSVGIIQRYEPVDR